MATAQIETDVKLAAAKVIGVFRLNAWVYWRTIGNRVLNSAPLSEMVRFILGAVTIAQNILAAPPVAEMCPTISDLVPSECSCACVEFAEAVGTPRSRRPRRSRMARGCPQCRQSCNDTAEEGGELVAALVGNVKLVSLIDCLPLVILYWGPVVI